MRRRQVIYNILANLISTLIGLAISFLLTPYIVSNLGAEAYSYVPISSNFTAYMAIMTTALTSMTARFVTLNVHQNDFEKANKYYSTSFFTNAYISLIVFFIFGLTVIFLPQIINIPLTLLSDVRLLFMLMFLTFITNLLQSNFIVPAFCSNRLDVTSSISILGSLSKVGILVVCFIFFEPRIYYIGLATLGSTMVMSVLNIFSGLRIMPMLRIQYSLVKKEIVKELFSSGIWNSFNQLSAVLLTGMDILIANIILGPNPSGLLAVAKTAPLALQTLVNIIPSTFSPFLTIMYAKVSGEKYLSELISTVKYSSILLSIPIAGFIILAPSFLKVWVPSINNQILTDLSLLTMISMVASFSVLPLQSVFGITNRLKWSSLAIFISGVLNITLVMILIYNTDLGLYAIAGVSSFLEIFRNLVFVPLYAAHCLGQRSFTFYPIIGKSILNIMILMFLYALVVAVWPINNWTSLIACAALLSLIGLAFGITFMLSDNDKKSILANISSNSFIKRLFSKN